MEALNGKYAVSETGCWEWTRSLRSGYGVLSVNGKNISAHRYSYQKYHGEISNGMLVCHRCDNKKCVNPNHLFLGTYKENMQDCLAKGRMVIPNNNQYKKGHKPKNAKPSGSEVLLILEKIKFGTKLVDIAKETGIYYQTIRDIKSGRSYTNVRLQHL